MGRQVSKLLDQNVGSWDTANGQSSNSMAQFYNALLRISEGEESKIIGSALITQNTKLPPTCVLSYGRKHFNGTEEAAKILKFASPRNPIQVYLNGLPKSPNRIKFIVKTLKGKNLLIEATQSTEIGDVKILIERKTGIPLDKLRLIHSGKQLEDGRTLADYNFTFEEYSDYEMRKDQEDRKLLTGTEWEEKYLEIIYLVLRFRGGDDTFWTVNLNSPTIQGKGIETGDKKLAFFAGLNAVGKCSNANCETNQRRCKITIQGLGYGVLCLDTKDNIYRCNVCSEKFNITNFLVCGGRSRFRAENESSKIDRVVESNGRMLEYTMFYPIEVKGLAHYESVEINTVGPSESLYECVYCNDDIRSKQDEKTFEECGHGFHLSCQPDSFCKICKIAPTAFFSEADFNCRLKNQLLRDTVNWQRDYIKRILPDLTDNTYCTEGLLNHLLQNNVISDGKREELARMTTNQLKVSQLYSLIPSNKNGYKHLINALIEEKQSVAAQYLLNGLEQYDPETWRTIKKY